MDTYHAWFDLKSNCKDLEFSGHLQRYLDHLKDQGKIQGYRLARRKLGFGPAGLGEFHVAIEVTDLAQLDEAFSLVVTRQPGIEALHAAVYSASHDVKFALYRDFPGSRPGAPVMIPLEAHPPLNAALNAVASVLIASGYLFVRAKRVAAHKACMLSAVAVSVVFLASYLYYHFHAGSTPFPGQGFPRTLYFTILISHAILAAVILPLVTITVTFALRGRIERHRKIARWTLPLWLYVSVTGVVIYWMLYQISY